jgi:hypothetical protein
MPSAMSVTLTRSSAAPVEISLKTIVSATRPPRSTAILSASFGWLIRNRSSVGRWLDSHAPREVRPVSLPAGEMEIAD